MNQVLNFLLENWQLLAMVLVLILEIVVFFLKKKPQVNLDDHIKSLIDEFLPGFILLAEQTGSSGPEKLAFVVSSLLGKVKRTISSKDEEFWKDYIISKVEAVLSTPQKKG